MVRGRCVFDWKIIETPPLCGCRSPDGRSFTQVEVRKVRTPQGNAPHASEGREPRGTRTESAAERYRRWPARAQARVKWWSKSPPRIRVTGRHGKPRVVQDRTGEGRPARFNLRVLVAPCASRALRSGGVREMAVQPRKRWTKSGLQGSGTPPVKPEDGLGGCSPPPRHQPPIRSHASQKAVVCLVSGMISSSRVFSPD